MLNIKDLFIKSIVLSIKVLFTESDSNAVQEAKGLVKLQTLSTVPLEHNYYLFHSCRAAVCTEDWTT